MQRYNVATRIWIGMVLAASVAITILRLQPHGVTGPELAALASLALGAAIASAFPIRSASGGEEQNRADGRSSGCVMQDSTPAHCGSRS